MAAPRFNKFALGNNGGRPPKFKTPEELEAKIQEYFEWSIKNNEKITITGLVLFIGMCGRNQLDEYAKKSQEFMNIIKRAKTVVENSYELNGGTIDIFALKNMGWKDTVQQEIGGIEGRENEGIPIVQWVKGNDEPSKD